MNACVESKLMIPVLSWAGILHLKNGDLCSVSPRVNQQCGGKTLFLSLLFHCDAVRRVKSELKVNFSLRYFSFISFPAVLLSKPSFLPLNHIFWEWIITEVQKKTLYTWGCLEINKLASYWRAAGLSVGEKKGGGAREKTALHIDTMAGGEEGTAAAAGVSEYNKQER